jgi:hypothetical protein
MDAAEARRRFGLLLAATLLSLGVQGIVPPGDAQRVLVSALAGLSIFLAFRAAQISHHWVRAAGLLALAVVAVAIIRATAGGVDEGVTRTLNAVLVACGPPAVAVGVLRELRSSSQVRMEAVMGVLALYILVGMLFAFVYGAIDQFGSRPFFDGGHTATVSHCLYFSFVTLTTVGYGDFAAHTNLGHTLAVFEALIGQIYLVTVVSVIVSNLGRPRRREDGAG